MKELETEKPDIIIIGIGNTSRGDDGLGWEFLSRMIDTFSLPFDWEYRYQLQVEDSELIQQYKMVVFADASHTVLSDGFEFKPCQPARHYLFSSHAQNPETVMYLAHQLYGCVTKSYTMAISGYEWELGGKLSPLAEQNLSLAMAFMEKNFEKIIQNELLAVV
jgi:hydrogenase maturation protease